MDQIKINIVNTEVLQSGIETLLNALVEGTRELAGDLQKPAIKGSPVRMNYQQI